MNGQQSLNPTKFEELKTLVNSEELDGDVSKAYRGNKAAGVRVRKAMQEAKVLAQETREEMLSIKENLPNTKS